MYSSYDRKTAALVTNWENGSGPLQLKKSTISNLFRYETRGAPTRRLSLADFNTVLNVDRANRTADVEGLSTYSTVVERCLEEGLVPLVAPELKHITVGGATVGIGIESTCFHHGFVHDGLLEADVLLPGGDIVTCRPGNEYADLFHALPNSYGTLGYILRARIALQPALPYVHLRVSCFKDIDEYLDAMRSAVESESHEFVEGLFFGDGRYFLITGRFAEDVPAVDDIVRRDVFYKLVQRRENIYLTTFDYIFRYDPEWFWNIPDSAPYNLFRRFAPLRFRNSGFYTRYTALKNRWLSALGLDDKNTEPLIQDWQVPWRHAGELVRFCLNAIDLGDRPWAAVPLKTPRRATLYPVEPGELYFNLGSYCQINRPDGIEPYHYTKIMDDKCFSLGGIKMLYSSSFMNRASFDGLYNGEAYRRLKSKYDPGGNAPDLYDKVVL